MTYRIQTLNAISSHGLDRLPASYEVGSAVSDPDGILVRSADLHSVELPPLPENPLAEVQGVLARLLANEDGIPAAKLRKAMQEVMMMNVGDNVI